MTLSATKINKVRQLLVQQELDAAVFTSTANFAWLTGGDSHGESLRRAREAGWAIHKL